MAKAETMFTAWRTCASYFFAHVQDVEDSSEILT